MNFKPSGINHITFRVNRIDPSKDFYGRILGFELIREMGESMAVYRVGTERSEEHTSELQSRGHLVCRLLLEKKKNRRTHEHSKNLRTRTIDAAHTEEDDQHRAGRQ